MFNSFMRLCRRWPGVRPAVPTSISAPKSPFFLDEPKLDLVVENRCGCVFCSSCGWVGTRHSDGLSHSAAQFGKELKTG